MKTNPMRIPSAPQNITWWIANILALAGIIMYFIPSVSQYAFWPAFVSAVLLLFATRLKVL